jgi:anti-sigma regulatory factor (Ser/Thr protein kinase)
VPTYSVVGALGSLLEDMGLLHERWMFSADTAAPGRARRALRNALADLPDDLVGDVLLLATEVLTNSIRHADCGGRECVNLEVSVSSQSIVVRVTDPGSGDMFGPLPAAPTDTRGRGLMLVDELADRWGIDRSHATSVWFELSLSDAGARVG